MRNSIAGALLALGLVVSSHSFGGSGESGRENGDRGEHRTLKVFDGHGHVVGPLVSYQPLGTVIDVNGVAIFAPIQRSSTSTNTQYSASQFQWSGAFSSFLTTDCSGSPLITPSSASSSELRPAQLVRQGTDVTAYIAGDTRSAQTTFQSYRSNGACVVGTETLEAWIAETSYPLTQHYPEPLTIHY
ncbi:hypothetical protein [uncultured Paraburkholderia sp.]|uniref:hypothetical protein n=1 Tax=uncultured Paraburkholderia sp. TaxID=1822466 RepID=UPI002598487C|nr:hypothetical protein [uncultured Paraburkholderia sp.]